MIKKKIPMFVRSDTNKYSRLGLRRKKKQVYRRARGGENKVRLKMKGHVRNVSIGYRSPKQNRGYIAGLKPVLVHNLEELKKITNKEIAIVAHIGMKKKLAIARYAKEKNIKLANLNVKKFIRKAERLLKIRKESKQDKQKKKKDAQKRAEKKAEEKAKDEKKQEEKDKEENKNDKEKTQEDKAAEESK
jgi:large subunit ribosomal protein L32e